KRHRRQDDAHRLARDGPGRIERLADFPVRRGAVRAGLVAALCLGQPADHVAHFRNLHRLCRRLHGDPETLDAAKHRHRRRLGRDATRAGLGRHDRRCGAGGADPFSHHLPVDAAALLGAGAIPRGGLPQVRPADASSHPWQRVHAAADIPVHPGAVRGVPDAFCLRHEFVGISRGGSGAERGIFVVWLPAMARLLGRLGAKDLSFFTDPPERAVRGAAGGPLPFLSIMNRRNTIASLAALAVAAAFFFNDTASTESKPQFKSVDLTGADYGKDFQLTDHNGQVRSLKDFRGKVVVVFFGYTQCPDVCPTSMAELAEAKKLLGADGAKIQGLFITLDPERDTPEVLKAYMANFDPGFLALRGTPEQVAAAAKEFKVFYRKVPGQTATSYTLDHSAASFTFDTQGRLRLYTRYGSGAQVLASDLKLLLNQA